MPNKLAIWVPYSAGSGLGHFYRNLGLYEQINASFYFFNSEVELTPPVQRYEALNTESPQDIEKFLLDKGCRLLWIDHYSLKPEILKYFSESNKIKVAYFDRDFSNPEFSILVNSNPFASIDVYKDIRSEAKYFMGEGYYLFRSGLHEAKNTKRKEGQVFIAFGGSDVKKAAARLIPNLSPEFSYSVVLGAGVTDDYMREVEALAQGNSSIGIYRNPSNVFKLMAESTRAVVSCSTTFYECCFLGTPAIAVPVVDNQTQLARFLKSIGCRVVEEDDLVDTPALLKESLVLPNFQFEAKSKELLSFIRDQLSESSGGRPH